MNKKLEVIESVFKTWKISTVQCTYDHIPRNGVICARILLIFIHFRTQTSSFCNASDSPQRFCHTVGKLVFPFPFKLNGIWSWWRFCFRFWTKWNFIWLKIESKIVSALSYPIQNRKENCHHDHIPFNLKGIGNIVFSV